MEKVNWRTAFFCIADRSLPYNLSTYSIFFLSFLRIFFYLHGIFIAVIAPLSKSMGATKYYFAKHNNTTILFMTITRIIRLVLYTIVHRYWSLLFQFCGCPVHNHEDVLSLQFNWFHLIGSLVVHHQKLIVKSAQDDQHWIIVQSRIIFN